jgi:hypothetical protein
MVAFAVFILVAIIADNLQYFGNNMLTVGVKNVIRGINEMKNWFTSVDYSSVDIYESTTNIATLSSNASVCGPHNDAISGLFSEINVASQAMSQAANSVSSIVTTIPPNLNLANEYLEQYAISKKDLVMYIFYGFIEANLLLLIIARLLRSKLFTQFMILLAEIIIFLLTIICCVEMVVVVSYHATKCT